MPPAELRRDTGFTLIELVISSMLLVLVLAVVGGIIASLSNSSKTVSAITGASTAGQLTARSIERGIRNSSDFLLTSPTGTDQMLVARTAQGNSTISWVCAAWYYSAAAGTIRYTTSPTTIPAAPSASTLSTWTLVDQGITPISGTSIFNSTGALLTIGFNVSAGSSPPVAISSSAVSRAGSLGLPACY